MSKGGLIVCVSGGRDFEDIEALFSVLDDIHAMSGIASVLHGDCPTGADRFAKLWCREREVNEIAIKADWNKYDDKERSNPAGILRNQTLIEHGFDLLVAFPTDGPGTKDMIQRAKRNGIPYRVFGDEGVEGFFS